MPSLISSRVVTSSLPDAPPAGRLSCFVTPGSKQLFIALTYKTTKRCKVKKFFSLE
jgi:hypothetical protein